MVFVAANTCSTETYFPSTPEGDDSVVILLLMIEDDLSEDDEPSLPKTSSLDRPSSKQLKIDYLKRDIRSYKLKLGEYGTRHQKREAELERVNDECQRLREETDRLRTAYTESQSLKEEIEIELASQRSHFRETIAEMRRHHEIEKDRSQSDRVSEAVAGEVHHRRNLRALKSSVEERYSHQLEVIREGLGGVREEILEAQSGVLSLRRSMKRFSRIWEDETLVSSIVRQIVTEGLPLLENDQREFEARVPRRIPLRRAPVELSSSPPSPSQPRSMLEQLRESYEAKLDRRRIQLTTFQKELRRVQDRNDDLESERDLLVREREEIARERQFERSSLLKATQLIRGGGEESSDFDASELLRSAREMRSRAGDLERWNWWLKLVIAVFVGVVLVRFIWVERA